MKSICNITVLGSIKKKGEFTDKQSGQLVKYDFTSVLCVLDGTPTILKIKGQHDVEFGFEGKTELEYKRMDDIACGGFPFVVIKLDEAPLLKK